MPHSVIIMQRPSAPQTPSFKFQQLPRLALAPIAPTTTDDHQVGPLQLRIKEVLSNLEKQNRYSCRLLVYGERYAS